MSVVFSLGLSSTKSRAKTSVATAVARAVVQAVRAVQAAPLAQAQETATAKSIPRKKNPLVLIVRRKRKRKRKMHKIMFVCLGNICRSPMAELLFKDMVKRQGVKKSFISNPVQPRTKTFGTASARPCIRKSKRFWKVRGFPAQGKERKCLRRRTANSLTCSFVWTIATCGTLAVSWAKSTQTSVKSCFLMQGRAAT